MPWANKEDEKLRKKEYYKENEEKIVKYQKGYRKEYYIKNKESILKRQKEYAANHKERCRENTRRCKDRIKEKVFTHYGNGSPACVLCGYDKIDALSIDHINGGGTKHRAEVGGGGENFYNWLKRNNYPDGYRVLCMNCQFLEKARMRAGVVLQKSY